MKLYNHNKSGIYDNSRHTESETVNIRVGGVGVVVVRNVGLSPLSAGPIIPVITFRVKHSDSEGNTSHLWKLKAIWFIRRKTIFHLQISLPSSADRLNCAQYIKPPRLPNTLIKTFLLENNKNQHKNFCQT